MDCEREQIVGEVMPVLSDHGDVVGLVSATDVVAADLRLVMMVLHKGARIPAHHGDAPLTIHGLDGHVTVTVVTGVEDLQTGQSLVVGAGAPYAIEAVEDSAILLAIKWAR